MSAFLLAQCERGARGKQAEVEPGREVFATVFAPAVIQGEVAAIEAAGYAIHSYHLRMQIDLEAPPPPVSWPDGLRLRNVVPGRDDWDVYNIIMTAFQKPGRIAPSFDSWQGFMMRPDHFIPELWWLVHSGDALVGAALCFDYDPLGWVRQLGVAEAWRRQGIASALLQHVFGEFYRRGRRQVALGVEADNANAYALYEKVGMRRVRQYNQYRKRLQ
jgi:GNAT superfamily N-acetyltransferase